MTIKSTYALDAGSVRTLEQLARRWRVSKSEALRRAIRGAAGQAPPQAVEALKALDRLQHDLDLTPARARAWARRTRAERGAASARRQARHG
ncbi:MAG: ribbon-helix-helix protein, CopG family [Candidatus Rokuibacteriota bacterium]